MPTRKVKRSDCQFISDVLFMAEGNEDEPGQPFPISLHARTSEPIEHWYWGRIVHDFAGMENNDRIQIDSDHWNDVGYLDKFDIEADGLHTGGELVPWHDRDKASELIYKGTRGVPYQASIDWSGGAVIEEVGEGFEAEVNGRTYDGPLTVVRQWKLQAVAIVNRGQDDNTSAQFAGKRDLDVTITIGGEEMTETTNESIAELEAKLSAAKAAQPAGDAIVAEPAVVAQLSAVSAPGRESDKPSIESVLADQRERGLMFYENWGAIGAECFARGRNEAEAADMFAQKMKSDNKELKTKLSAAGAAAGVQQIADHVQTDSGEAKPKGFAQFIRMPNKR